MFKQLCHSEILNEIKKGLLFENQGIPYYVQFNGNELKREFHKGQSFSCENGFIRTFPKLDNGELNLPVEGTVSIYNDDHSIIAFRVKDDIIICLFNSDIESRHFDRSNHLSSPWCNRYYIFLIKDGALDNYDENTFPEDCYNMRKDSMLKIFYDPFVSYSPKNVIPPFQSAFLLHNKIPYSTYAKNVPVFVANGYFMLDSKGGRYPFEIVIYFDIRREDYLKYFNSSIQILLLLSEIFSQFIDIRNHLVDISSEIWKIKRRSLEDLI
jgi:hypothetical protein